jgi:hypothetical protein
MKTSTLVQKLWNHCSAVRVDGKRHGDYVEQLTDLLFQEMADDRNSLSTVTSCTSAPPEAGAEIDASPKRPQGLRASKVTTTFGCSGNPK